MNRRSFLIGAVGLTFNPGVSSTAWAQDTAVKLLLMRERGYQVKCLRCVAGKLFGVSANIDLATAEQAVGLLSFITDTVELSYEPDSGRPSSIPEGDYTATVRTDATKKWMWSEGELGKGTVLDDRAWRLELANVSRRSNIQFHFGRDANWSQGCIIIGQKPAACPARGSCSFPNSPEPAVRTLRSYVERNAIASNTPIRVRIASA